MNKRPDYARPLMQRWLDEQRCPVFTWKRFKACVNIAWIMFDLWYSEFNVRMLTADLSTEISKQADLKKLLAAARRELT